MRVYITAQISKLVILRGDVYINHPSSLCEQGEKNIRPELYGNLTNHVWNRIRK